MTLDQLLKFREMAIANRRQRELDFAAADGAVQALDKLIDEETTAQKAQEAAQAESGEVKEA